MRRGSVGNEGEVREAVSHLESGTGGVEGWEACREREAVLVTRPLPSSSLLLPPSFLENLPRKDSSLATPRAAWLGEDPGEVEDVRNIPATVERNPLPFV